MKLANMRFIFLLTLNYNYSKIINPLYSDGFSLTDKCNNIRSYHECEGRIEKSVPRITIWIHKACRVMTNAVPGEQIFLSYPHTNIGLFFLLTNVFIYLTFIYLS